MSHRIKNNIYAERESLLLRKLVEVVFIFAFALPAIAKIGVVAGHDHDPAFVIENSAVVRDLGVLSLPGDARVLALDAKMNIGHLRFLLDVEDTMKQGMLDGKLLGFAFREDALALLVKVS